MFAFIASRNTVTSACRSASAASTDIMPCNSTSRVFSLRFSRSMARLNFTASSRAAAAAEAGAKAPARSLIAASKRVMASASRFVSVPRRAERTVRQAPVTLPAAANACGATIWCSSSVRATSMRSACNSAVSCSRESRF